MQQKLGIGMLIGITYDLVFTKRDRSHSQNKSNGAADLGMGIRNSKKVFSNTTLHISLCFLSHFLRSHSQNKSNGAADLGMGMGNSNKLFSYTFLSYHLS
jgi:hypothetical protein